MTHIFTLSLLAVSITYYVTDASAASEIQTYQANYGVFYKDQWVGNSEFSVTQNNARGTYTFESTSRFRGVLSVISPNPITEISEFTYDQGQIQPLLYSYDDGTWKGDGKYRVEFDWDNLVATTTLAYGTIKSDLTLGILDRGSMQVSLMLDMWASKREIYTLIDESGVSVYEYLTDGEVVLETPLGTIVTRKLIQQKQGSSRRTIIWVAEELNYLPIRIEQQRNGASQTSFNLQTIEWLEGDE
jgi:hypothetical protein